MATLTGSRSILYTSPLNVTWTRSILYASGKIGMYKSILYTSSGSIQGTRSILYSSENQDYIDAVTTDKFSSIAVKAYYVDISGGAPYGVSEGNAIELTNLLGFSINIQKNQPVNWSLTLDCQNEDYSPFNDGSSWYEGSFPTGMLKIFPQPFSNYFTLKRVIFIQIDIEGILWTSPPLVIQSYDYSASSTEGYLVNLSGTDPTLSLYRDNQSMSSWVSTNTDIKSALEIIQMILNTYLPYNYDIQWGAEGQYGLNDWNYPVPVFHMPSIKPIDAILELMYINQSSYFWEGHADEGKSFGENIPFTRWQILKFANDPEGTLTRGYQAGESLYSFNYKRSSVGLFNQIDVRRVVSTGYLGGDVEGYEFGFYTLNFTGEAGEQGLVLPPTPVIYQEFGEVREITYFKELGLSGDFDTNPAAIGTVKSISFTFQPSDNPQLTGKVAGVDYFPYFHVWFRGKLPILNPLWGQTFDSEFAVRVSDTNSINKYGLIPCPQVEENALIPNQNWATILGTELIRESNRLVETAVIETPLDPLISIGQFIKITEPNSGLTDGRYFQVESKSISLSGNDLSQTLNLTRYLRQM